VDSEIESIWNGLVGNWVSMDFNQPNDKIHSKHSYFGTEAISLTKEETFDSDEMVDYLISVSFSFLLQ